MDAPVWLRIREREELVVVRGGGGDQAVLDLPEALPECGLRLGAEELLREHQNCVLVEGVEDLACESARGGSP